MQSTGLAGSSREGTRSWDVLPFPSSKSPKRQQLGNIPHDDSDMAQTWLESQSIKTEDFNNANCYTEGKKRSVKVLEACQRIIPLLSVIYTWFGFGLNDTGQTLFLDTNGAWIPAIGSAFLGYLSPPETQGPGVPRNNSKSLVRGSQGPGITGTSPAAVIWLVSPRTISAILWF